jgi:hypothetical protein
MALVLKDRVKETTTTTGTGSFALAGAVTGYDSFGQIGNGNTTYYAVYLDGGSEWEVGIGTYTAPSTLSRDTILASSNAGSVVTFSAGQKTIWCDYPAGKAVYTDATGSISQTIVNISGITGDISTPDSITFDTTAAETSATAKLFWDDGDGVLSNGLKGGNVTLQVGTQQYARVYNDSGTTLTKGQAVYISGAQGNRVAVKLARADVEATSFGTIGLVAETMTNGSEGFIIVSGALYKLNTTGLIAGATVYLSPTTAGAVTTTKPQAPDQLVVIGWVERVDNTVGSIYVKIDNGYELDELHDVQITSPQSGNLLIYDATTTPTGVWKNANLTDGTGITITEGAGSVTIANAGVTALSAGTGISVSGSTGSVTVTNSAPDQTVSISAGTGISVTGTYPNFTVTNTSPDVPFTYTTNYIPYGQGTTTPTQSANLTFNGTTLTATGLSGPLNGTVGATTPNTGAFTTLTSNGATTFTANTASTSTTTGTAVITGGLGVSGRINAANFDGIVGANTAAAGSFTTVTATSVNTQNTFGFKNRIINGAMVIDQRNAGAEINPAVAATYYLDRWVATSTAASKYKIGQNAGSVTPPVGFTNYLGTTSLSAYTVGAGEAFAIQQRIEGYNVADLAWGTANAKTVTLSFWVRSSLTGTFGGSLRNGAADRSYPYTYSISSANTWEYKTVTVTGDTSGTWLTTNGIGLSVFFSIGMGSSFSGTAGAWAAANYLSATGATSVVGTNGATFYITGVQLEVGSTATSFDTRSYGDELILCQRYYQGNLVNGNSGTSGNFIMRGQSTTTGAYYYWLQFPVLMRAAPTMNVGTVTYSNANSALFFNAASGGAEMTFTVTASGGYIFVPWRADIEL